MAAVPDPAAIARDPAWLANRYDESRDLIHFVRLTREEHRAVTFITDEYIRADAPRLVLGRSDVAAAAGPPAPLHFIFHSAYCCSTVLARAVDIEGVSMGLKEPLILNDMVGWRRRGADPRLLGAILDDVLTLLARPFAPGEAVVVKPSNVLNSIAPAMLGAAAAVQSAPAPRAASRFPPLDRPQGAVGSALGARAVHRPASRRDGRSRPRRAALSRPHRSPGGGGGLAGAAGGLRPADREVRAGAGPDARQRRP